MPKLVIFALRPQRRPIAGGRGVFYRHAEPATARAVSAGTQPAERVHPEVVAVMGELGIDLATAKPVKLTAELAQDAALLGSMGCGESCPVVPGLKREDWPLSDPKGQPLERVREIRDVIERRVRQLVARDNGTSVAGFVQPAASPSSLPSQMFAKGTARAPRVCGAALVLGKADDHDGPRERQDQQAA